ncbi:hypothetical protein BH11ARM2_BH11ARM2_29450 [soil metagenome]
MTVIETDCRPGWLIDLNEKLREIGEGQVWCDVDASEGRAKRITYQGLPFDATVERSLRRVGLSAAEFCWTDALAGVFFARKLAGVGRGLERGKNERRTALSNASLHAPVTGMT